MKGKLLLGWLFATAMAGALGVPGISVRADTTSSPTLQISAQTVDGINSGTVRLGETAQFTASVSGTTQTTVNWSVSGSGSITAAGIYQAPATMPTAAGVTVTGTLADDPSISASYPFTLIYPHPTLFSVYTSTGPLISGASNVVTMSGAGFVPRSTGWVNGSSVRIQYISPGQITTIVDVPPGAQGSYTFAVGDPLPGGNTTPARSLSIRPLSVSMTALDAAGGVNPASLPAGLQAQFAGTVSGSGSALGLTWSVAGAGTISASGLYTAPASLPSAANVTVTARVAANQSVQCSYPLSLNNPEPVIGYTSPTQVAAGSTTVVTINGRGFVSGTTLAVNGVAVPVTVHSANQLSATITVPVGQVGGVALVATNPDPGGSTRDTFTLPVGLGGFILANVSVTPGTPIPDDFLGVSYEWGDQKWFMGTPTQGINPIYRQMLRNLMQGHSKPMWIRLGGGTSDHSTEPTASTLAPYISLANAMPVKFAMGVNLAADNVQLAEDQAQYFAENMPPGSLTAIEIGNEPDAYPFSGVRPPTYTVTDFLGEFGVFGDAVASVVPSSVGLMGPSLGDPKNVKTYLATFIQEEQHVSVVSIHGYVGDINTQKTFTPEWFLGENVATWWPSQYQPHVKEAHDAGELLRIGEINSVDQGGVDGVSNTMTMALWAVDTMFEYARTGVDGVNWHGTSACAYCPFTFGTYFWNNADSFTLQYVNPLYYGFLIFQAATQNGAQLLPVSMTTQANVKIWATEDRDNVVRVVILDKDVTFSGDVAIAVPGFTTAQIERLTAPSYKAEYGVTLNGQSFDGSIDGRLVGTAVTELSKLHGGAFNIGVQPGAVVLLTLLP